MLFFKECLGHLTELAHVGLSQSDIVLVVVVKYVVLICLVMKQVVVGKRVLLLAFISKDEVYPPVQVLRSVVGLKCLSKPEDDLLRAAGPLGTLHVVHFSLILLTAELQLVAVAKELRP